MSSQQKKGILIERLLNVVHFEIKQLVEYEQAIYIEFLNIKDRNQPLRMECVDEDYWVYRTKISPNLSPDENIQYQYFVADYFDANSNRFYIQFKYDTSFPKNVIQNNFTIINDNPWMEDSEQRIDVTPEKNLMYFAMEYRKEIKYGEAIYVMWFSPNEEFTDQFTEQDIKRSQRLIWNPGHSWQGTVVIKKDFFIKNKGQFFFPLVKSFYFKRQLSEFQFILQDEHGNKKAVEVKEDNDITERAIFEGKDANIRIELNDLDNSEEQMFIEIEGFGVFEVLCDDQSGSKYIELLADREFFENDNNKLKLRILNKREEKSIGFVDQQPIIPVDQKNTFIATIQEPQDGQVSQISITAKNSLVHNHSSTFISKPTLTGAGNALNSNQTYNSNIYHNHNNQNIVQCLNQSNHTGGTNGTNAINGTNGTNGVGNQNNTYNTSYQRDTNLNNGQEFPSLSRSNDWQNYYNPLTNQVKKTATATYITQLASKYTKYKFEQKQVRPPQENFKFHQSINFRIHRNLSNPQFQKSGQIQKLVNNINQSFVHLTNYYEYQEHIHVRIYSKQFPTRRTIRQFKECNYKLKQQYEEVSRQLKSRVIVEEKDVLKDAQIRIIQNIPNIKEKMTRLENFKKEQEQDYKLSQQEILQEEKLSLVVIAKKWGLAVMGQIIDLNYSQVCAQIFAIVDKVLQTQYSEAQLIKACLQINQDCKQNVCPTVSHSGCQTSMQNRVDQDFSQYIQNLQNQNLNHNIYKQLKQLVLESFDCYIEYGKSSGLQLNYCNQHEKPLLITLVNYCVLYSCANKYNSAFPQFQCSGCTELGPFCKDKNTQFTYQNLCKLQQIYSQKFTTRQVKQSDVSQQIQRMEQQIKQEIETCIKGDGDQSNRELMDLVYINADTEDLIDSDAPALYQIIIDALDENAKMISIIELEQDEQKQKDGLKELVNQQNRDKIKAFLF